MAAKGTEQAKIRIKGVHLGSSKIFSAIKRSNLSKRQTVARDKTPEAKSPAVRKRRGAPGSFCWYSATNLDRAVDMPAVVMAKQMVEMGKIS